jgi:hypothetical protein
MLSLDIELKPKALDDAFGFPRITKHASVDTAAR